MTTTATKTIDILLRKMMEKTASDLHLAVGSPPIFRIDGKLIPENSEPLSSSVLQEMIYSILDFGQREKFEKEKELDFSYSVPGLSRFRGNILLQRGTMGAASIKLERAWFHFSGAFLFETTRTGFSHRTNGFWKIDNTCGNDRLYQ
jgi:Tfp pilus assembly pilus retraction ATPase PilT